MSCLLGHDVGFKIWEATEQQQGQIRGKVGAEASLRHPLCHVKKSLLPFSLRRRHIRGLWGHGGHIHPSIDT
jgi:hypothetical protein